MRIARLLFFFGGTLLVAILLSLSIEKNPKAFSFQVDLAPSDGGRAQVYYDVGRGYNESDSVSVRITPSTTLTTLNFPLTPGQYRALRFDPIDGASPVRFARARIATTGGSVVRAFAPQQFKPNDQIAAVEIAGDVATVRPGANVNDPFLILDFDPPLELRYDWTRRLHDSWPIFLKGYGLLCLCFGALWYAWRNRESLVQRARQRPRLALLFFALLGAVAASYPVVFFGTSFVSPNVGAALLHSDAPTVPGYADTRKQDVRGADVGAMMWQHLPYSIVQARALLHGEWPLWNRYNSSGVTLLGQGQSMFGDPIHLLVVLTNGASWAWDVKFVTAKMLFAAALALCVWQLTRSISAAALIALAAPFIGFFNYRVNHPAIFSVCYSPWILYGWFCLSAARHPRQLAGALGIWTLANVSVLGSGTAKEAYMLALSLNATGALLWLLTPPPGGISKWRRSALISATIILCALFTAPLWLIFFDALKTAHTAYEVPHAWQVPRALLIGLFDDLFIRELMPQHFIFVPAGNLFFLLGALWAVVQPGRLRNAPGAIALLAGSTAAIALGFEFIPAAWLVQVPLIRNVYHLNNIFSAVAVVHIIVLAGWGFAVARDRLREPHAWRPLAGIALLGLTLLLIYFRDVPSHWLDGEGLDGWSRRMSTQLFFYLNLALMLAACAVLACLSVRFVRRPVTPGAALLAMFAAGVMLYRHGQHLPMNWGAGYIAAPAVRADLKAPSAAVGFVQHDSPLPWRVAGTDNDLFPGFASVYGFEGINGPDAIMNAPYRELAEAAGLTQGADWRFLFENNTLPPDRVWLELLGVRYLLSSFPQLDPASGYRKIGTYDLDVYRNDHAWPRAFFTDRLAVYKTPPDFVSLLGKEDGHPFAAMQSVDLPLAPRLPGEFSARTVRAATDYQLTPNTTRFVIDAPTAGVAVLTETFLPLDFRVTVDRQPVPYFRVNHAFKAVFLDRPGRHEIAFTYWPRHFTLSLFLAATGGLGLVLLIARLWSTGCPPPLPRASQ